MTLESVWPDLTTAHKLSVQQQLKVIFARLRAEDFGAQGGEDPRRFGSFETGVCKDTRRNQRVSETPIATEAAFNEFLCRAPGRAVTAWITMIYESLRADHRIVMTHGDLHPRNIMVSWEGGGEGSVKAAEDVRVTAIIDWDSSPRTPSQE